MTADAETPHIGLIVEGPGDQGAVPLLLRSWRQKQADFRDLLGKPIRTNGRDRALREAGLEGYVYAAAARPGCRAVLIVLDGEGDPVCKLGPILRDRAKVATDKDIVVALADPMFEAWIVASAETMELAGLAFAAAPNPATLIRRALASVAYAKPTWQPRLTARMDFDRAIPRSASLKRLLARFDQLVDAF